jgi:hypothetical protein
MFAHPPAHTVGTEIFFAHPDSQFKKSLTTEYTERTESKQRAFCIRNTPVG